MNEIICPNCKKAFKVDQAGYADILKQVRDHQFEKELKNYKMLQHCCSNNKKAPIINL